MEINKCVNYEKKGNIVTITMTRPEKMNALNSTLVEGLHESYKKFSEDVDARVAILTGEGRAFSVGADVKNPGTVPLAVPDAVVEVKKPIIAAVNGYCIGAGLVVALMSDIRIATEDSLFSYPEAKIGVTGGIGSRLTQYIPRGVALELLLVGDQISSQRAYEIGLVNHVVPKEKLLEKAQEIAEKIADNAPMVVEGLKRLARQPHVMEGAMLGSLVTTEIKESEDRNEGIAAFREKRKPEFKGR